jgi:SAM-dependent methyltransferase
MDKCWCGNTELENYSNDYFVCRKCGTLVTKKSINIDNTVIVNETTDLYGENYWTERMLKLSGATDVNELIHQYLTGRVLYWIQYILKYIPINNTVAEVGCGLGQLAYTMKHIGYQMKVYEISPEICRFLRNKMGLDTFCGEFGTENEIYETILSFDLLEHLEKPEEFVFECYDRLWGTGIFCCQTPCYTEEWTYEEMLLRKPSFNELLIPDQHIYIFSKRSIKTLLENAGFKYITFEPPAFGEYYDMFFIASKESVNVKSSSEVREELYNVEGGRLINVLIDFYSRLSGMQI